MNVLPVGDSITHGSNANYGNWRTGLMKKLAAAGYEPVAKGHRYDDYFAFAVVFSSLAWLASSDMPELSHFHYDNITDFSLDR